MVIWLVSDDEHVVSYETPLLPGCDAEVKNYTFPQTLYTLNEETHTACCNVHLQLSLEQYGHPHKVRALHVERDTNDIVDLLTKEHDDETDYGVA